MANNHHVICRANNNKMHTSLLGGLNEWDTGSVTFLTMSLLNPIQLTYNGFYKKPAGEENGPQCILGTIIL